MYIHRHIMKYCLKVGQWRRVEVCRKVRRSQGQAVFREGDPVGKTISVFKWIPFEKTRDELTWRRFAEGLQTSDPVSSPRVCEDVETPASVRSGLRKGQAARRAPSLQCQAAVEQTWMMQVSCWHQISGEANGYPATWGIENCALIRVHVLRR